MKRKKHYRKAEGRSYGIKGLIIYISFALTVLCVVGGSVAWLMTSTDPIKNVFTYGDITITLEETTGSSYKMVPGNTISKDPKVTVLADSEDCWLFVKIEESDDAKLSDYISYSVATGWKELDGAKGVYYQEVNNSTNDTVYSILSADEVTVKQTVTKEMISELDDTNYPSLTFTAYAVQRDADIEAIDTAAEAWALIGSN